MESWEISGEMRRNQTEFRQLIATRCSGGIRDGWDDLRYGEV